MLTYPGFIPGQTSSMKRYRGFFFSCSRRASHARRRRKPSILYLVEGKKTKAGRDRIVPIPTQIQDIIKKRAACKGTNLLFTMRVFDRKGKFQGFRQMSDSYFRESVFKPLMARLGIAEGKVPYSARHTYANKLKKAEGDDRDKAALIGHSDYTFTQTHYQSTSLEDLEAITSALK